MLALRDGKEKRIKVELELRTKEALAAAGRSRDDADGEQEMLGLKVQELTDGLAQRLNYEEENGVVVTRVKRGSEASRRGLRRWMLIEKVNSKPVETVDDFADALAEIEPGAKFRMRVRWWDGRWERTRLVGMQMPVN